MSKIISIGTAVPAYKHTQDQVLEFMQRVYAPSATDRRKMRMLYNMCGIDTRYSVVPDYSLPPADWQFYPATENLDPFPAMEQRMAWYQRTAMGLSLDAIRQCLQQVNEQTTGITHLITVSCTGMSAPGLDLQLQEALQLPPSLFRSSINFMGCYAAVHALKWADTICRSEPTAGVMIVCTELCTLHFQRAQTMDNIASSMLFADGSAAAFITGDQHPARGLRLDSFYSEVAINGRNDMAWELSSQGFQMKLSSYIPSLLEENFESYIGRALEQAGLNKEQIAHWCIHPGGRKILEAITHSLHLPDGELQASYDVMRAYGNMSSPTILFVLKAIADRLRSTPDTANAPILGAAFGPGLTMETFIATPV